MSAATITLFYDDGQKIVLPITQPFDEEHVAALEMLRVEAGRRRPRPVMFHGERSGTLIHTAGLRLVTFTNDGDGDKPSA